METLVLVGKTVIICASAGGAILGGIHGYFNGINMMEEMDTSLPSEDSAAFERFSLGYLNLVGLSAFIIGGTVVGATAPVSVPLYLIRKKLFVE